MENSLNGKIEVWKISMVTTDGELETTTFRFR